MNKNKQIKAIYKLAGWTLALDYFKPNSHYYKQAWLTRGEFLGTPNWETLEPNCLSSRDVIVPIIESVLNAQGWDRFPDAARKVLHLDYTMRELFLMKYMVCSTAEELGEILLRTTDKWIEE